MLLTSILIYDKFKIYDRNVGYQLDINNESNNIGEVFQRINNNERVTVMDSLKLQFRILSEVYFISSVLFNATFLN